MFKSDTLNFFQQVKIWIIWYASKWATSKRFTTKN